jgi:hypothetical protein
MGSDARKFWKIEGYDGAQQIFEKTLPLSFCSEDQMIELLQRLAARNLTLDEIVRASLRPNSTEYAPLLEAHRQARASPADRFSIVVGVNPHYVASIWTEEERSAHRP